MTKSYIKTKKNVLNDFSKLKEEGFTAREINAFDEILELAEKIQAQKEDAYYKKLLHQLLAVFFVIIFILLLIFAYTELHKETSDNANYITSLVAILTGLFASVGSHLIRYRSLKVYRREKNAFNEVMSIVHEIYDISRSDLSALENAEFKIRLSRLDH